MKMNVSFTSLFQILTYTFLIFAQFYCNNWLILSYSCHLCSIHSLCALSWMKQTQKTTICFNYIYIIHLLGFVISFLTTNIVQMYVHVRIVHISGSKLRSWIFINWCSHVVSDYVNWRRVPNYGRNWFFVTRATKKYVNATKNFKNKKLQKGRFTI